MDVYETVKTIGSGSFGQVYMARHKREGKHYVVKRVKTRDMSQKDLENTENEVRLLQKIRHSNIVAYKDSYVDREQFLNIVMVYCDGGDIYSKIKAAKGKHFSEDQILDWLVQMSLALFYLHERKILHRDMKTQNIFLKNGKIRLGDFGIAKVLDSTKDFANTCIGTPYYMSPELFKNKPYGYKSDVWALGCVLYEMCNLRHAFDAQTINGLAVKILRGSYPPINQMYSKPLRDLIGKMLQIKPSQRPTIVEILQRSFVSKRVAQYINECIHGEQQLAPTDVDDMFPDGLREQAGKLMIPGYYDDSTNSAARLMKRKPHQQKPPREIKTQLEQKKEILKLKKEIQEKKMIQSKLDELQQQVDQLGKEYKDKFGMNPPKLPKQVKLNQPQPQKQQEVAQRTTRQGHQSSSEMRKKSLEMKEPRSSSKDSANQNNAMSMAQGREGHRRSSHNVNQIQEGQQKPPSTLQQQYPTLSKDISRGRLRPNDLSNNNSNINIKNSNASIDPKSQNPTPQGVLTRKGEHVSSQSSIKTLEPINPPLNSYKDFANVFTVKGMMHGSKSRKHSKFSSDNQSVSGVNLSDNSQANPMVARLQSQQSLSQKLSPKSKQNKLQGVPPMQNPVLATPGNGGSRSRERILKEKELRKQSQQLKVDIELEKIRIENVKDRQDASYRPSEAQKPEMGPQQEGGARAMEKETRPMSTKKKAKKIQEEYSMYDEEARGDDDDELEDIQEEPIDEEESEDSEGAPGRQSKKKRRKNDVETQEQKERRMAQKEELKNLNTQMLSIKDQLAKKANKIEEIKSTLKQSQLVLMQSQNNFGGNAAAQMGGNAGAAKSDEQDHQPPGDIDQSDLKKKSFIGGVPTDNILEALDEEEDYIEKKLQDINEAADPEKDAFDIAEDSDDDFFDKDGAHNQSNDDEDYEYGEEEDDFMDNGIKNKTDPQILKLQDRIKFFRHRCVASLGNNIYEKACDYLKESNAEGCSAEEKREGLIQVLGEEWIGFWAILDQILFYEGMIDELNTLDTSNVSDASEEIHKRKGISELVDSQAALDQTGKNQSVGALNEDSDIDIDQNDGEIVGGSGSEKGDIM